MRQKARYVLYNGDTLVLMRKSFMTLFFWRKYENFDNHKIAVVEKMEAALTEFEKQYDNYVKILELEASLVKEIHEAREEEKNHGPVKLMKLNLFKPAKKSPVVNSRWKKFAKLLGDHVRIGDILSGSVGSVAIRDLAKDVPNAGKSAEVTPSTEFPIQIRNQQGKQKQQQQQQNR